MTRRDWRRVRFAGKPRLSVRDEARFYKEDQAARFLKLAEHKKRRQKKQSQGVTSQVTKRRLRAPMALPQQNKTLNLQGVEVITYCDTLAVFAPYLPSGARLKIAAAYGKRVRIVKVKDKDGIARGAMVYVHQVTVETIKAFAEIQNEHPMVLSRVDIAFDFIPTTPASVPVLSKLIEQSTYLIRRRKGQMVRYDTTTYWVLESAARNLVGYPAHINGKACFHLELRSTTAAAVRRLGITKVEELLTFNPRKLFHDWVRMVTFNPDKFKRRFIRETVKADRLCHLKKKRDLNAEQDRYRAGLAKRINGRLVHSYRDCVQLVRDRHPRYVKRLRLLSPDIPRQLSFDIQRTPTCTR
jgi:hypothetical protein